MFEKPVEAKALQRLSGADKKKLRRTTKERFPQASDADIDAILPPKTTNGFRSCIMGKATFTLLRLIISVISQILCSYSTLPLYVIVTQMGSSFKKDIFDEHIQANILDWTTKAKEKKGKASTSGDGHGSITTKSNSRGIQMRDIVVQSESSIEEGTARLI